MPHMRNSMADAVARTLHRTASPMQVERFNVRLENWFGRYGNGIMAGNLVAFLCLRQYDAALKGPLKVLLVAYYVFAIGLFLVAWYSVVTSVLRYRRQRLERHLIRSMVMGRAFIDPQGDGSRRCAQQSSKSPLKPARKWTVGPR
jgi:hypothetical protein